MDSVTHVRKLALASLLLALYIVCTNISSMFLVDGFSFARLSLGPSVVIFSSIFLGPFYGAIVGAMGDVLAILLRGAGGTINPLITVLYGLLGIIPYFVHKGFAKKDFGKVSFYLGLGGCLLLLGAFIYVLYGSSLFDSVNADVNVWLKPVLLGVMALLCVGSFVGVYFLGRKDGKAYGLFLECTLYEIFLMVALKSVAFYVFYAFLSGGNPIDYVYLLTSLLLIAPINVLINVFAITLYTKAART